MVTGGGPGRQQERQHRLWTRLAGLAQERVVAGTASLFSHGAYPLARTLDYWGDPGLFGPESMTWPVVGDTAVFVGGSGHCWCRPLILRWRPGWRSTRATGKTRWAD